jgi:hypothetical protein
MTVLGGVRAKQCAACFAPTRAVYGSDDCRGGIVEGRNNTKQCSPSTRVFPVAGGTYPYPFLKEGVFLAPFPPRSALRGLQGQGRVGVRCSDAGGDGASMWGFDYGEYQFGSIPCPDLFPNPVGHAPCKNPRAGAARCFALLAKHPFHLARWRKNNMRLLRCYNHYSYYVRIVNYSFV